MAPLLDAPSYQCPRCGAPVAGNAQACSYCHVPLTTRRCAHCFDHSPASARHCATCGRELGLERIAEASTLRCPACHVELAALSEAAGTLFDCARCQGHFVEHALLRVLIEQRAALAQNTVPRVRPKPNPFAERVSYRPCPRCNALMHRKNFGGASGVIIDVCVTHGIWFDAGELPAVLNFVESGGLERERQREAERALKARVERRAATQTAFTPPNEAATIELGLIEFVVSLFTIPL
jgi:Zn-finger nucleic acid-binding protein